MEQQCVNRSRQGNFLRGGLNQRDVAPTGGGDPRLRLRQHLGAVVEAVDLPAVADAFAQQRQAQAGAAGDIQHALSRLQVERGDGAFADGPGGAASAVVTGGALAVLGERTLADGGVKRRRYGWSCHD